jgi:hypothetical protein
VTAPRPALAGAPPPEGPTTRDRLLRPTLLERLGAAAFVGSATLTALFGSSAWPDHAPDFILAPFHIYVLRAFVLLFTFFALAVSWAARRPALTILALIALPLLVRHLLDLPARIHPWSPVLGSLAGVYLLVALGYGVATLVRTFRASAT